MRKILCTVMVLFFVNMSFAQQELERQGCYTQNPDGQEVWSCDRNPHTDANRAATAPVAEQAPRAVTTNNSMHVQARTSVTGHH